MGSWLGLDNKVIIVTGGSAGIGRSIVKYYYLNPTNFPCLSSLLSFPLISELFWIGFDHYLDHRQSFTEPL
jgi:hypothetical protein